MYHDSSDTFRHLQQNGLQHLQKHCEQSPCSVRILQRMFARYQGFLEAQRSLVAARGIALSPSELTNEVKLRLCRQSPAFLICIFHSVVVYMCVHNTPPRPGERGGRRRREGAEPHLGIFEGRADRLARGPHSQPLESF